MFIFIVKVINNNLLLSNWSVRIGIKNILNILILRAFNPVILFLEMYLKYKPK